MQPEKKPPRPRKYPQLWQSYLLWDELMLMRQRHNLRIAAIETGVSPMDAQLEQDFLAHLDLDTNLNYARKTMISYGKATGEIWDYVTSIKGLKAGGEAAKLIAQIDDISRYDSISKLWRFAGFAVFDGKAERGTEHFNRKLKSICFTIADMFIKQQTPGYIEIYYEEKKRQRDLHPEAIKDENGKKRFNDGHLHNRAWRKMIKQFLADLWLKWRTLEGLPITEQWRA